MEAYRILDGHVHAFGQTTQGIRDLVAFEKEFGYEACNYLSCECMGDAAQNALGIYLKLIAPENYAFGGLNYRHDYDCRAEMEALWALGLDGMKMVEQKPTLRKELGVPFNDRRYDGLYAALEERQIPLLSHVGDPADFWVRERIPAWAAAAGYFYGDGTYLPKEQLHAEVDDVLARYPRLKIIMAHLFFLSDDLERLDALLETHPNVCLDIVAGTEMYFNFGTRPEDWRAFFIKHQDRIIYGTDNSNLYDAVELENARITNRLEQETLTQSGVVHAWDNTTRGLHLPEDVCRKIYRENFLRLVGEKPRKLDKQAAGAYLRARLEDASLALTAQERAVTDEVLRALEG